MCEVVQVSQDTQKKSEKAVALLPPKKAGLQGLPGGGSLAGWEGEAHWAGTAIGNETPGVLGAAQRGYTKFCAFAFVGSPNTLPSPSFSSPARLTRKVTWTQEIQVSAQVEAHV